ncbi:multidrug efflux SMR transporter [Pseudomonas aeruginosa]|uniref:DMT family transporter n=1 Tax=Pseudomonas aeruginosa TaxID=287 RepID=UPI0023498164|nr:SMR family transporter [Pseudomonas aeruginosa]MDG4084194.1 SMR family transporter [Pseudomonas aeruginosa]
MQFGTYPLIWTSWSIVIAAGILGAGWPLGLRAITAGGQMRWVGLCAAVTCMAASGALLWLALKRIPISVASAAWAGIAVLGNLGVGALLLGDVASLMRSSGTALIAAGIACLSFG